MAAERADGTCAVNAIENAVGHVLRTVCVALFAAIMVLMIAIVFNRILTVGTMDWSDEVIEFLTIWMVFCGSAEVWRTRQHFFVETVPGLVGATAHARAFQVLLALACLAFIAVFTWQSFELFQRAVDESPYFSLSRRLWYGAMPLNGALMTLFSVRELYALAAQRSTPPAASGR
jgi:TRAP-type C4-dicarboxylate transport system permease small subunit